MKAKFLLWILLATLCFTSCRPRHPFSDIPTLQFVSLEKIDNGTDSDNEALLTVYFTDGDGNIGLNASDNKPPFDTASEFYYNFFITYYEVQNGVWVSPENLKDQFNIRLPRFLSSDIEEPIDGNIESIININNPYSSFDTIRFECYLVDRDLNKSNIIYTDTLVVNK